MSTSTTTADQRVAELEATVARLTERLDAAGAPTPQPTPTATPEHDEAAPSPTGSRRKLFKLAAGAAAGGTALALAQTAGPVAAADDSPLTVGSSNSQGDAGTRSTSLVYENAAAPEFFLGPLNIMTVRDTNTIPLGFDSTTAYQAAIGGWANRVVQHGVYGRTSRADGYGVVAHGTTVGIGGPATTGLLARGTRANLELDNRGAEPSARTDAHLRGEMIADEVGNLWYCTAPGSPGEWRKLAGATTAGAYHAVTPFRVYDSRFEADGSFAGDENRTVSVSDARSVTDYSVAQADAVPAGATAVTGNVVAIAPGGNGFLAINPGGVTEVTASTLNWTAGQNIANGSTFALNTNREVEAVFGPGAGAHMALDVTGYYL
ncbi:MAG: hypothetical protein WA964_13780 [Ilumatobacter sp.]|uniref:hypothetical protein n=1 Tax=Ilumatobacter sp. TaxID=1967498 RepID=UPI003C755CDB